MRRSFEIACCRVPLKGVVGVGGALKDERMGEGGEGREVEETMACWPEETRTRWGVDEGSSFFAPWRMGRRRSASKVVERVLTWRVSSQPEGLVLYCRL